MYVLNIDKHLHSTLIKYKVFLLLPENVLKLYLHSTLIKYKVWFFEFSFQATPLIYIPLWLNIKLFFIDFSSSGVDLFTFHSD